MSKPCNWCGFKLFWFQNDDDTWTPYEDEALTIIHSCPKRPGATQHAGNASGASKTLPTPSAPTAQPPQKKVVKARDFTDEEKVWLQKFVETQKIISGAPP